MPPDGSFPPGAFSCHRALSSMTRSDFPIDSDGIDSESAAFAERLLAQFLTEPSQVSAPWRRYFNELLRSGRRLPDGRDQPKSLPAQRSPVPTEDGEHPSAIVRPNAHGAVQRLQLDGALLQERVDHLIRAYRVRGHLAARLDPLGLPRPMRPDLSLEAHGLAAADLDRAVSAMWIGVPGVETVRDVVARMWSTYCRYIGVQFMHIDDLACPRLAASSGWRAPRTASRLLAREQLRILTRLTDAVIFEEFIAEAIRRRQKLFA